MKPIQKRAHRDWVKEYFDIIHEPGFFLAPGDAVKFEEKIHDKASKFPYAVKRDLTARFLEDFEFRNGPEQNFVIVLEGKKRRGKSKAALKLCKMGQNYNFAEYNFTYSKSVAKAKIKALIPHSTVVIDENLQYEGKGAINAIKEYNNIIAMSGKYCMNFVVNIQEFLVGMKNVDAILEIFGYNKETGVSRCMWRDDNGKYLGRVYLDQLITNEEYAAINITKDAKWESLMQDEGAHRADDDELVIDEAQLDDFIMQIKADPIYKSVYKPDDVKGFLLMRCKVPNRQLKVIKSLIAFRLGAERQQLREQKRMEKETSQNPSDCHVSSDPIITWEDAGFRDLVLQCLQKILPETEFEVFSEICADVPVRTIARHFFNTATNVKPVSAIRSDIQTNYLGKRGGEAAYNIVLQKQGKNFEYFGWDSDEPDFIVHSDREIISLKCYTEDIPGKAKRHIGKKEISAALRLNYNLFLLTYSMIEGVFKKYRVSLPSLTPTPSEKGGTGSPLAGATETPLIPGGRAASPEPTGPPLPPPSPVPGAPAIAKVAMGTGGVSKKTTKEKHKRRR